jgi:hypothetical protein
VYPFTILLAVAFAQQPPAGSLVDADKASRLLRRARVSARSTRRAPSASATGGGRRALHRHFGITVCHPTLHSGGCQRHHHFTLSHSHRRRRCTRNNNHSLHST